MTNAVGTINLLEAAREHCPESPFIFLSTNKVYGDGPNKIILRETPSRYDFADILGVNESMSIDQTLHSPFGASKASADLMVQEYGKYYDMPTVCFRCGCLTGVGQQGVELHGFLNYLCKTAKAGKEYTVYGHGGKQVRDMLHVSDLVNAFHEFAKCPSNGEVYNMGGGYANSISILEAIQQIKNIKGLEVKTKEGPARKGDHVCYYSNLDKFRHHYPSWNINKQIKDILEEMLA
jgi:CDP-paratose 2-epimerase